MKKLALLLLSAALATAQPVTQIGTGNVSTALWFGGLNTGGKITGAAGQLDFSAQSLVDIVEPTAGLGTVTVTATGTTVAGVGTTFTYSFIQGQTITANGETHTISAIASDTSMTTDAWTGAAAGVPYTLVGGQKFFFQANGNLTIGTTRQDISGGTPRWITASPTTATPARGVEAQPTANVTTGATAGQIAGGIFTGNIGATNTQNWTSTTGGAQGVLGNASVNNGAAGTITAIVGGRFTAGNASAGTVTTARGAWVSAVTNSGGGTLTNGIGLNITAVASGTNKTQLLSGTDTPPSGTWEIYSAGTGNSFFGGKITGYNNLTTAGNGLASIQGAGRVTAQTAAAASIATYTVGAADASFLVSANVNLTAATTASFSVTCAYTDETNAARTLTLGFTQLSGATLLTVITNVTGTGPYESIPYHIRCKAATAITIASAGTFTSVTYNAEGVITKLQ